MRTNALERVAHGDVDVGGQAAHDGLAVAAQAAGQRAHLPANERASESAKNVSSAPPGY